MASKLIIIRGNSGSGKSTVAKKLQHKLGDGTMLIPQDVVRREILRVKETSANPSTDLIKKIATFGKAIDYNVIIEGILTKKLHGKMLKELIEDFDKSYVYYFDIPFEETFRRHQSKSVEFGKDEMRKWWHEQDYLDIKNEIPVDETLGEDEIVDMIYERVVLSQ